MVPVPVGKQLALLCGCGRSLSLSRRSCGLCRVCQRRRRLSRERFEGRRESILRRDAGCLVCGSLDQLVCHHRPRDFATLCRADHARVHHLCRIRFHHSEKLRQFWRELHPEANDQLELPFFQSEPVEQLAFAAA